MTAVPGVPAEAIEAAGKVLEERMGYWECPLDEDVARALAAALPSLREVIAAEVLAPVRALVSDWEANGNSRELGDPTAHTWHEAARQLLDRLSAPVQAAEPVCSTCGGSLDFPPCSRSTNGTSGHTSGGGSQAAEEVGGDDD